MPAGISKAKSRRNKNKRLQESYKAAPAKAARRRITRLEAYIAREGEDANRQSAHARRVAVYERDKGKNPEVDARRMRYIEAHNPEAGKNSRGVELAKEKLATVKKTHFTKR